MRLFLDHQKKIYSFILMMSPNWCDADELMQETSAVMWQRFDTFEVGTNFVAWGIKIAH
ncbi:MAG: RNA polymerase subunit sigma-70, partial [Phycisphaerae bacterium]|nr:RNA polymerase subunit sigma-70 [Phycisphaerae bacterium]